VEVKFRYNISFADNLWELGCCVAKVGVCRVVSITTTDKPYKHPHKLPRTNSSRLTSICHAWLLMMLHGHMKVRGKELTVTAARSVLRMGALLAAVRAAPTVSKLGETELVLCPCIPIWEDCMRLASAPLSTSRANSRAKQTDFIAAIEWEIAWLLSSLASNALQRMGTMQTSKVRGTL
jgi:hypothetical protein